MKALLVFSVLFMTVTFSQAQDIFFPTKTGTVLVYKTFDKKDKQTGMAKYIIGDIKKSGNEMEINYVYESYDAKEKFTYKDDITIKKVGDVIYFDMSDLINKSALQQNGEIPSEVKITGNNMEVPNHPKPGDVMPDASVEMGMSMGFVNLKLTAVVTNRKVEAIEDITVKAGTFKAYKFTSDVSSTAVGIKFSSKNTDWYVKGIGVVKSETLDKNGKLMGTRELVEIQK
ncbi:MAG TPA: hypothetical protein P5084_05065 [Paludibacter sp.]|nr:hypothetical protein [Paludibacter sp.]